MELSAILSEDLVFMNLSGKNKQELLSKFVSMVCKEEKKLDPAKTLNSVMEREEQMSTGFENGIAIPHARMDFMEDFIVAVGICPNGVDFDSVDQKPTNIIVLILACKKKNSFMLQTLYALSTFFSEEENRKKILNAKTPYEVIEIIDRADVPLKKEITASDVMNTNIDGISPDETIRKVCSLFTSRQSRVIPVIDDKEKLIGEISENDVLKIGVPEYYGTLQSAAFLGSYEPFEELLENEDKLKVKQFMNTKIAVVSPETPVMEVAFKLVIKEHEMVYVKESNKLVGTIKKSDLIDRIMNG